jgi:hypothetical protein
MNETEKETFFFFFLFFAIIISGLFLRNSQALVGTISFFLSPRSPPYTRTPLSAPSIPLYFLHYRIPGYISLCVHLCLVMSVLEH